MPAIENALTHTHGWVGCVLPPGVDPAAPSIDIASPRVTPDIVSGLLPGVALEPARVPLGSLTPPSRTVPSALGLVTVAALYFALGVAVGAQARRLRRWRTATLILLILPGALGGFGFLVWLVLRMA